MLNSALDTNKEHDIQLDGLGEKMHSSAVEVQIGVLKEVVQGLLNQLDLLRIDHSETDKTTPSNLHEEVRRFEIELINSALCRTHGHQQKAARLLGVKATTLNSKIKRYNIMFPFLGRVSLSDRTAKG